MENGVRLDVTLKSREQQGGEKKRHFARSFSISKPAGLLHRFSAHSALLSSALSSLQSNVSQVTSMALSSAKES